MDSTPTSSTDESGDLDMDQITSKVDNMAPEERGKFFRQCSAFALTRHINESGAEEGTVDHKECKYLRDSEMKGVEEIGHIFEVRGSFWRVVLGRDEICKEAIRRSPQLINHPAMFLADLREATITCLNDRFEKK